MPWTLKDLKNLVATISFRDWEFRLDTCGDGFFLQVRFMAPDTETRIHGLQSGGKFYISSHAAVNEVIRTAHKAVLSAVAHEADEEFKVGGRAIYHPHISVSALIDGADKEHEYRA